MLARKTYTPNFKTHKSRKNRGERTQVYKRGDHEAIVPREVFEAVNRKLDHGKSDNRYPTMKVIDDGALRGFVPVDRTWSGFSSEDFKVASKSVYEEGRDQKVELPGSECSAFQHQTLSCRHHIKRKDTIQFRVYEAV